MSSTRRATGNGPLRQERFASSQEFERGLMANLVAKRCSVLDRAEDRELIWFLQFLSHQVGGLRQAVTDLLARYPERFATRSMQRFGLKPGQIYSAGQVVKVRDEILGGICDFPLKGELDMEGTHAAFSTYDEPPDPWEDDSDWRRESDKRERVLAANRARQPASYPASAFVDACQRAAAAELEKYLGQLCLDPALAFADGEPWYFPALVSTLREFHAQWIAAKRPAAVTSIGKEVCDALDYALEIDRFILIDGLARTGKTFAAKAWCDQHPGRARYCQVPSTNDDFSFFRALAQSLGVSINLKSKAQELRLRIEETFQAGDLVLVLDEFHYIWPQSHYRNTTPGRLTWLMTALVNHGIAVAGVTTPQFFRSQNAIETATCWTSEQFTRRIGHYQPLPESLTADDLQAVARAFIPSGDARSIETLALYAQSSAKYLAGIEAVAGRAQFIARKDGRAKVEYRDIKRAITESVIPSDGAFTNAMNGTAKPARKRAVNASAQPLQPRFKPLEPSPMTGTRGLRPGQIADQILEVATS